MLFDAKTTQRAPRIEVFRIVESGLTTSASSSITDMPEGFTRGTITETSANVYTLTYNEPFARQPVVQITCVNSSSGTTSIATLLVPAVNQCTFFVENDAGAGVAATEFHITVIGFDTADVI
jgi:hypothetical protein